MSNLHDWGHGQVRRPIRSHGDTNARQRADAHEIRSLFSRAMSEMYRAEVPQYGTLIELVNETNRKTLKRHERLRESLERSDELDG
jgi:uncharacterized glyoxalase superfamily metalloenzyme YdcJ